MNHFFIPFVFIPHSFKSYCLSSNRSFFGYNQSLFHGLHCCSINKECSICYPKKFKLNRLTLSYINNKGLSISFINGNISYLRSKIDRKH